MLDRFRKELHYAARALARDGFGCARKVAALRQNEYLTPAAVEQLQYAMLRRTLNAASRRITFYRSYAAAADGCDVRELLQRLPIVGKENLLTQPEGFYPNGGKGLFCRPRGRTSGTTGSPLTVVRSLHSILWAHAFKKRHWTWAGYRPGMRYATLRGDLVAPVSRTTPPFWFYNRYNNQLILSSRHLKAAYVDRIIERLTAFAPYLLEAYPSTAYELALHLRERNRMLSIPYAFTGSEPLYPHQRALIESRLGAKVMDHYGMAERVAYGTECEYGNLHVNSDYSYVEILDEDGRPTDEEGYVVGTTFHNLTMPLLRYRLSDRAKWKKGGCPCGRVYPVLEPVSGKYEDLIYGSDGAAISASVVTFAFKELQNVRCSQVAQIGAGHWQIRVVPTERFGPDDKNRLIANIKRLVDPHLSVEVKVVSEIPRTAAGKYRWVVNEYKETRPAPRTSLLQS